MAINVVRVLWDGNHLNKTLEELDKKSKHTLAADVATFQTKPGDVRIEASSAFNKQGYAGTSATILTGVVDDKDYGSLSVGATGAVNGQGELGSPTLSTRYVSPALINDEKSPVEAVVIGAVGVTVPTGKEKFSGSNVSLTAGGVLIHKESGVALTATATTNADGVAPALWGRVSGNIYEDDKTKVALNVNGGYDTANQSGSVGMGVLAQHQVSDNALVYGAMNGTINDVGGKNDPGVGLTVGLNYSFVDHQPAAEPQPSKPRHMSQKEFDALQRPPEYANNALKTEARAAGEDHHVRPNMKTVEQDGHMRTTIAPKDSQQAESYKFLDLSDNERKNLLMFMAENYKKEHPQVTITDAQDFILTQLAKANYMVDSHRTDVRRDDTPLQASEIVASR